MRDRMSRPMLRLCGALLLASLGGCQGLPLTIMYLMNGLNVDPEFDGLKGKRVAVVCRPSASLQYNATTASNELTKTVSRLLGENVSKVEIIPSSKVSAWCDENAWDDFEEVGRALDAQMVVGVDLDTFGLYDGQTLYKGTAECNVRVYDLEKGGEPVFEKRLRKFNFPPSSGIPVSDKPEYEFRQQFIGHLATQVGILFYPHDPNLQMALDSEALK